MARRVAGEEQAVVEPVGVREDRIGLLGVAHVFLDAEVGGQGRYSAAPMVTGERSVAPWQPVRTCQIAAKSAMRRRWVIPPAPTTVIARM